jgi:hipB2
MKYIAYFIRHGTSFAYICIKYATYCMMDIFETIRNRRALLGVTQEELADITGVSVRRIVDIERGKANPSFATLRKIAAALGLEITATVRKIV